MWHRATARHGTRTQHVAPRCDTTPGRCNTGRHATATRPTVARCTTVTRHGAPRRSTTHNDAARCTHAMPPHVGWPHTTHRTMLPHAMPRPATHRVHRATPHHALRHAAARHATHHATMRHDT